MAKNNGGPAFPGVTGRVWDKCDVSLCYPPGMSLREYAAIKLKVPDSGTDWLDDMIRKSLQDDYAGQAMSGLCANTEHVRALIDRHPQSSENCLESSPAADAEMANDVYSIAAAMLAERARREADDEQQAGNNAGAETR